MSQKNQIRNLLTAGKKVSQLTALRKFGCMRLADVIWKLRKEGFNIRREWREQRGARFAVYTLDQCVAGAHLYRVKNYQEVCKFCGAIGEERKKPRKRSQAVSRGGNSSVRVESSARPAASQSS